MTGPIPVELAREQLRELISILGELRNAGPRDQRFKQWRQITTTLLQRIWPGDPIRAERFRRIPFSAPTAFADRRATREYFERGCREAASYLDGLALELGGGATAASPPTDGPDLGDAPAADEVEMLDLPVARPADPAAPRDEPILHDEPFRAEEPPAQAAPPPPPVPSRKDPPTSPPPALGRVRTDPRPEAREPVMGPKPRLKDMLGFTDEPAPDHARARPVPGAPPPRAPVSLVPLSPEPTRRVTPPPVSIAPPPTPEPPLAVPVEPPAAVAPPAATSDERRDWAAEFVLGSPALQAKAHSALETEPPTIPAPESPAARELLALAVQVAELGVPARERAIVRAALIDLGRQMESPPINWEALRETVAFAMDHPALARRVLPLVLPYLDRAA
mgnify:CR=1 FL=1